MTDSAHILTEIRDNIVKRDAIKAQLVLDYLENVDQAVREQVIEAFASAPPDFAVPILAAFAEKRTALAAGLPLVREVLAIKILAMPELVPRALRAPQTPGRQTIIGLAGELRLEGVAPDLIEVLLSATDVDDIRQCIDVLGDIGDPQATNSLSDFLYSGNRTLIISAIKALGKIGTPTAMLRLAERMGTDNQLDLLILDIFARVQDSTALDKLNEAIRSHFAHLRTYAKKALTAIGPKAVPLLTGNLLFDDPDLQIHTLNVLGDIGDPAAIAPIRKLLHNQPGNANVRFAAYEALGLLPLEKGAYILTHGLADPVEHVCIAAAKAIDRNFTPIMAAGIKNLTSGQDEDSRRILKTAIDAQASHIFLTLIAEERMRPVALTYLAQAHQDVREFFRGVLQKNGHAELARELLKSADDARVRKRVCAVDDSRMILNIYKTTLYELGFEPVLFEFPASALEWLETEQPEILLTDLNMPDINGIDLCRAVRKNFSKEQLPVIMITTQNEANDNRAALEAGINDIMYKPFTKDTLSAMLQRFV
ncbi:MAG: response regulator [Pseudomonadota bacterium]|nr:response regulator [Pseudomonadota bacterium]